MANSPYRGLPRRAFWKSSVSRRGISELTDLFQPKFEITTDGKVATAGSCFAQHISRHLKLHGFNVLDAEPAPPGTSEQWREEHQFGVYSARYGNLYFTRQLLQLLEESLGRREPRNWIWQKNGRYFDALRPSVEPDGFGSEEEVLQHRRQHLVAVAQMFCSCDIFVFTFGLTEGWIDNASGTTYPTAPGTVCGDYDPDAVSFRNFSYNDILKDFEEFMRLLKSVNPGVKFLVTVSPVALAATATEDHVLSANTYSKSVLRAVAGYLAAQHDDVAYFPSYELITGPLLEKLRYNEDQRTVKAEAVEQVMKVFLEANGVDVESPSGTAAAEMATSGPDNEQKKREAELCEEALLEVFAK